MVSGKFDSNKDYIHTQEDIVEVLENTMPQEEVLYDLAELFKVFGDSTRIRILYVLFETEMCVYDLSKILNVTQSAISHQLRVLKQNKLVKFRREGYHEKEIKTTKFRLCELCYENGDGN